jgi:hypothetical protein
VPPLTNEMRDEGVANMTDEKSQPDLSALQDEYEILGELRGMDSARTYIANRRTDGKEVAVTVVHAAGGGEHNALGHFASDANILAGTSHPNMPRVLGGRWLGSDTVVVISERIHGPTLDEIVTRDDRFPTTRVAAVLQEVTGVIGWARTKGIVHRGVTADTVVFEEKTNRLLVSFSPVPVPIDGLPDACTDGRTLGALAWIMLTGKPYAADEDQAKLAELRTDLAQRVIESTETMLACKTGGEAPDVPTFLAVLAMADALRQAELEKARVEAELEEAYRAQQIKCQTELAAIEKRSVEEAARLEEERAGLDRHILEEEQRLAAERAELDDQLAAADKRVAALDADRAALVAQLADLEADRADLAAQRADFEMMRNDHQSRWAEEVGERARPNARTESIERPPAEETRGSKAWQASRLDDLEILPVEDDSEPVVASARSAMTTTPRRTRPRWAIPTGIGVALIIAAAVAGMRNRDPSPSAGAVDARNATTSTTTPTSWWQRRASRQRDTGSAAGAIAPRFGAPFATGRASSGTDSTARGASAVDSLATRTPKTSVRRAPRPNAINDSVRLPVLLPTLDTFIPRDTQRDLRLALPRPDSFLGRDFLRLDSASRRDTLKRDSIIRRDSIRTPPDTTFLLSG